ncbi:MAG: peptidase C11, partial [Lachnospiraceae bacterium]|nr:peptidase C11 [Lachnospiraceae bacterium]
MADRPVGRKKKVGSGTGDVYKRGDGQGTGPVGGGAGPGGDSSSSGGSGGNILRTSGGKMGCGSLLLIVIVVLYMLNGGGLSGLLGGGGGGSYTNDAYNTTQQQQTTNYINYTTTTTQQQQTTTNYQNAGSLFSYYSGSQSGAGWTYGANTGKLNTSVASGSRAKYTTIKGNNQDVFTIMVYMCGTDLESQSGMGTNDLTEMSKATIGNNINLIVYTGGCKRWRNNLISSQYNQIYQISGGKFKLLEQNAGNAAMTNPNTLLTFINYCTKNFPANRNALIFWDHGGGSLSGYGYDEKNTSSGSMSLAGINQALAAAGVKYDFIGFDACLMATAETALMLTQYADYLIASEETEPGVGWYYTNWLTSLSKNPSMSTLEIGKNIVDDFVDVCARDCRGQATTLSVIDLAEFGNTVPDKLNSFAVDTTSLITGNEYKTVSTARYNSREFASTSKIDQVDLVHLARNVGSDEGTALANAILGAVKYNRTSSSMNNAYGVSIYFPYRKTSSVSTAVKTYNAIGMDSSYTKCIQEFASLEVSGQVASGGTSSPLPSLFGNVDYSSTGSGSADLITGLLSSFLGGDFSQISGLSSSNTDFFSGRSLSTEETAAYISENQLDASALIWQNVDGTKKITLSEEQWSLVTDLVLSVFYDDGEGYLDLGTDNVFEFDDEGRLIGENDHTWLAINGHVVSYNYEGTTVDDDAYTIVGSVPCMINDVRANLILVFDSENEDGYVAGARYDYHDGETDTIAKGVTELNVGDQIDFLCDYYAYDGTYQDTYFLGDPFTVTEEMEITNISLGDADLYATYRFSDIYNQNYWTTP